MLIELYDLHNVIKQQHNEIHINMTNKIDSFNYVEEKNLQKEHCSSSSCKIRSIYVVVHWIKIILYSIQAYFWDFLFISQNDFNPNKAKNVTLIFFVLYSLHDFLIHSKYWSTVRVIELEIWRFSINITLKWFGWTLNWARLLVLFQLESIHTGIYSIY